LALFNLRIKPPQIHVDSAAVKPQHIRAQLPADPGKLIGGLVRCSIGSHTKELLRKCSCLSELFVSSAIGGKDKMGCLLALLITIAEDHERGYGLAAWLIGTDVSEIVDEAVKEFFVCPIMTGWSCPDWW